ncbi:MAG: hypothetical protein DWQ44_09730 [Bacteroidetes bacterium]|nr:MAG: hypothetical protein DWQ39_03520 [Bacteroidota bacterium]REK33329.1 MAG: hypothetical protein DWQ44_09730 [Bacteroidota bacterium]REK49729.1 MAG: hypothetical protein DWQ48_06285 [Bacteroidota bacterium]
MFHTQEKFILLILIFSVSSLLFIALFTGVLFRNIKIRNEREIQIRDTMISTQEYERNRIAEDMHDEIGPRLSAIKLNIQKIESELNNDLCQDLIDIKQGLNEVISNIRTTSRNLSSQMLAKIGLVEGIKETISLFEKHKNVKFQFNENCNQYQFSDSFQICIFRIVSELINNSVKHSNCDRITINLIKNASILELEYSDNGKSENKVAENAGLGLSNISNRVKFLNGNIIRFSDSFETGAYFKFEFRI